MVCFTDVPLTHSLAHCGRYGRFGIAFHKLKLMNVGAQPVFYVSHAVKRDMDAVFRFLQEQTECATLPLCVFRALHRYFYFMQRLSDGRADARDTYYYEREWRLGAQTLPIQEDLNPRYHCQQAGYGAYFGRRIVRDDKEYFSFDTEDVAFLVTPTSWESNIGNPHGFRVCAFEELVGRRQE